MPWVDLSDNDPGGADQFVRAALRKCWHALPPDRQTVAEVERVFRRLTERALRDLSEDSSEFPASEPLDTSEAAEANGDF